MKIFFTKLKFVHATPNYRICLYSILRKFSPWNPHLLLCDLWYFESFLWLNFYLSCLHEICHNPYFTQCCWARSSHEEGILSKWSSTPVTLDWSGLPERREKDPRNYSITTVKTKGLNLFRWGAWLLHGEAQKLPTKSTKVSKIRGHGHSWHSWWSIKLYTKLGAGGEG